MDTTGLVGVCVANGSLNGVRSFCRVWTGYTENNIVMAWKKIHQAKQQDMISLAQCVAHRRLR